MVRAHDQPDHRQPRQPGRRPHPAGNERQRLPPDRADHLPGLRAQVHRHRRHRPQPPLPVLHLLSRSRYGTHGCQAQRLPAEALDTAILHALADFYTSHTDLIADAVTRAQQRYRDGRAEHAALLAQITQKETAIDRYFTAFENGTMAEETAGERLQALRGEITQLTVRAEELADAIGAEPAPPPPSVIERLQTYLAGVMTGGTPGERKAAIEAFIAEIRITDEGVIPVFRIPGPHTPIPDTSDGGADDITRTGDPVRAMGRSVGRLGLEPRTGGL